MFDAANHFAADFLLRDKTHVDQPAQMKRQCRSRYIEARLNLADVQAGRSSTDQQPVDIKARQIAQFGQTSCGKSTIHTNKLRPRTIKSNYNPSFIVMMAEFLLVQVGACVRYVS